MCPNEPVTKTTPEDGAAALGTPAKHHGSHRRVTSDLDELTVLEVDHLPAQKSSEEEQIVVKEAGVTQEDPLIPKSTLVIVTDTNRIERQDSASLIASLSDFDFACTKIDVKNWDLEKFYSDYIADGLSYLEKRTDNVVMLFESPSSSSDVCDATVFHNKNQFKFHDWPPPKNTKAKGILGPCRYSLMNGSRLPAFLRYTSPPAGLLEHWEKTIPGIALPKFKSQITDDDCAYAYLPVEQIKNHVNDPTVHYHLAGKDAIHLMTQKTTKLLPDTRTVRPCVVKTTHSMGSKGIFIIRNDQDEAEFEEFLRESGNPTFVVTDFVDIRRNVACHFFMHPDQETVIWFGSNENKRLPDGRFSSDSYLEIKDQKKLKNMQLPFVEEVVQYCQSLGFWGFCGIDVLFDGKGRGHLVDINPRVTGSCPALMTLQIFKKEYGFQVGLFRRSGDINYYGKSEQLMEEVDQYNAENEGRSRVVIHSMYESGEDITRINIGVYGNDMEDCKMVLNRFAQPKREEVA